MILLLDVGNTRLKWAWLEHWRVGPAGAIAHDATHRSWQREIEADGHRPARIVVSSVAGPAFAAALTLWARDHYRVEPEFLSARAEQCGVRNSYARPSALGVDRWLGLIGAWRSRAHPTLIVSAGTALTVDALDGSGRHCGGLIVPGVAMMRDARARFEDDLDFMPATDGSDAATRADCSLRLLAALADRSVEECADRVGTAPRVILTGGDAPLLRPLLRHLAELIPDLVLAGLAIVAGEEPARGGAASGAA